MRVFVLYILVCFLAGYFWRYKKSWRFPFLFLVGCIVCFAYYFLHRF